MSTKIYNGYYINKNISSLYEIKQKLVEFQNKISKYILDDIKKEYKNESIDDIFSLAGEFEDSISNSIGRFFIIYGVEIIIIPIKDKNLCLLYTRCDDIKKMFLEDDFLIPYYYYNNSDKPSEISTEKWDERKNDWEEAFLSQLNPSLSGFHFQLIDSSLLFLNIKKIYIFIFHKWW